MHILLVDISATMDSAPSLISFNILAIIGETFSCLQILLSLSVFCSEKFYFYGPPTKLRGGNVFRVICSQGQEGPHVTSD